MDFQVKICLQDSISSTYEVGSFILRCGFTEVGSFILRCGFSSQDLSARWHLKRRKFYSLLWIFKSRLVCRMASQVHMAHLKRWILSFPTFSEYNYSLLLSWFVSFVEYTFKRSREFYSLLWIFKSRLVCRISSRVHMALLKTRKFYSLLWIFKSRLVCRIASRVHMN